VGFSQGNLLEEFLSDLARAGKSPQTLKGYRKDLNDFSRFLAAGARSVHAVGTHGVFSGPAIERLAKGPFEEVVVTDTLPLPSEKRLPKITVLSVAPLFAEAIRRIHLGLSVGEIYQVLIQ